MNKNKRMKSIRTPTLNQILNFICELGMLKRIKHEGWRVAGVEYPESVAEHSLRAAQIGFILAKMEKFKNPYKVASMVIFHDIGECRIGDLHKIANRYVNANELEAVADQTNDLDEIGAEIFKLWEETENRTTKAGILAKDADLLEQAVTAKEYLEKGYNFTQKWIDAIKLHLQTKSAQMLCAELQNCNSNDWWQSLK